LLSLAVHHPIFRVWAGVDGELLAASLRPRFEVPLDSMAPLQRKIVRDTKQPTAHVVVGLAAVEMLKQRKKHFLENLFAIRKGKTEVREITQERISKLIEAATTSSSRRSRPERSVGAEALKTGRATEPVKRDGMGLSTYNIPLPLRLFTKSMNKPCA
jgi:hypothetical protein